MSQQFPTKRYRPALGGPTVEGELVVETSLVWQVAVHGKVQVLQKKDWVDVTGSFEDVFSMFGQGGQRQDPFGGLFGGGRFGA